MSNAIKGALLSGLVFPGLGQVAQKHRKRGFSIMLAVLVNLLLIVYKAVSHAYKILEQMELESGIVGFDSIPVATSQSVSVLSNGPVKIALVLIVLIWIFGIVDAYRIGARMDCDLARDGQF